MSSTSQKITFNIFASSISKILGTVLALLAIRLIADYLTLEKFGWYITGLAFFAFFGAIGDWGIYQITTRKISEPNANESEILSDAFGLRIFISLILSILVPPIIWFLPDDQYPKELKIALVFIFIAHLLSSFYQLIISAFQKRLAMEKVAIAEFIGKVCQVAFIFWAIKNRLGFQYISGSLLVNMLVNFILVFWFAFKITSFFPKINWSAYKEIFATSLPVGISVIIAFVYYKADTLMLSFMKSASDVGIYGAAYKIIDNLNFFPGMVVGLVTPMMAYWLWKDREHFKKLADKNIKFFTILVAPLAVGGFFLAGDIVRVVSGNNFEGFDQAVMVFRIIIFSLVFIFFGQLFNSILITAGLQKKLLWMMFFCAIFNVSMNLIFIPKYSYLATSITSVATEFLVAFLGAILIHRNLKFTPKPEKLERIFAASFLMALYLWLLKDLDLGNYCRPFKIVLGGKFFEFCFYHLRFIFLFLTSPLIYFGSLFVFNVLTKKEILELIKKPKKSPAVEIVENFNV